MRFFLAMTVVLFAAFPAFAEDFSFTKTMHSQWTGEGSVQIEIINNPEDDYIHVVDSKKSKDIFCYSKEKQATKAVFLCGTQEVTALYSEGMIYFNNAPYKRLNGN